jgi:hypothetical protein
VSDLGKISTISPQGHGKIHGNVHDDITKHQDHEEELKMPSGF